MMYKKRKFILVIAIIMEVLFQPSFSYAEEPVSDRDILLIYSDHLTDSEWEEIETIVRFLTYQEFRLTYVDVSSGIDNMELYSHIICFQIEDYPDSFIDTLYKTEQTGKSQILFAGSEFLHHYLNETKRDDFTYLNYEIGKVQYDFYEGNQKETLNKENSYLFLDGDLEYEAGKTTVQNTEGYFCASKGAITHIPVADLTNNVVQAAFFKEIALWMDTYHSGLYGQYLVLNQVYPFQDPNKLLKTVDILIEKNLPFVVSVMPIYTHGDYPAMQKFCEILRYAQANGGSIIINSPINQMPEFNGELANEYLTNAIEYLTANGVYPLGIQVPKNWQFNSLTSDVMKRFSTIVVSDDKDEQIQSDDSHVNQIYEDEHEWIASAIRLDGSGSSYTDTNSFAVFLNLSDEADEIEQIINRCSLSKIPIKNLWSGSHRFQTNKSVFTYENQILSLNGERKEKTFSKTVYEDDFQYNHNTLQQISKDLTDESRTLIRFVFAVSILFLIFIGIARYQNRKRFLGGGFKPTAGNGKEEPSERELEWQLLQKEEQIKEEQIKEEQIKEDKKKETNSKSENQEEKSEEGKRNSITKEDNKNAMD